MVLIDSAEDRKTLKLIGINVLVLVGVTLSLITASVLIG